MKKLTVEEIRQNTIYDLNKFIKSLKEYRDTYDKEDLDYEYLDEVIYAIETLENDIKQGKV